MTSDELNRLLDDALTTYSRREPQPGLEQRVLDAIRAAPPAPKFIFPRWAFAALAAACLLILAITLRLHRTSSPPPTTWNLPAPAVPAQPQTAQRAPEYKIAKKSPGKHLSLPKRQEFPSPAPLTNEERALLAFVARAPAEAREVLMSAQQQSIEPIRIEQIHIQPLQTDSLQ
jgi:hypothetical protein